MYFWGILQYWCLVTTTTVLHIIKEDNPRKNVIYSHKMNQQNAPKILDQEAFYFCFFASWRLKLGDYD